MKDPAFLFYTGDFISGTQDMSCEEVGAYLRLLMHQHQHGKIPNEKNRMMRITGIFSEAEFDTVWEMVGGKFQPNGNHLVNQRMINETTKRTEYRPKKIAAGTLAGLISASKNLTLDHKINIKKCFNVQDFVLFNQEEIKVKVKEWFTEMVNKINNQMVNQMVDNIENRNENRNENENIIDNNNYYTEIENHISAQKSKIDLLAIQQKIDVQDVNDRISDFIIHSKLEETYWDSFEDSFRHFKNWLPINLSRNPKPVNTFKTWTNQEFWDKILSIPGTVTKETKKEFFEHYSMLAENGRMRFQNMDAWETKLMLKKWLKRKQQQSLS